jgi:hypothetical protein
MSLPSATHFPIWIPTDTGLIPDPAVRRNHRLMSTDGYGTPLDKLISQPHYDMREHRDFLTLLRLQAGDSQFSGAANATSP